MKQQKKTKMTRDCGAARIQWDNIPVQLDSWDFQTVTVRGHSPCPTNVFSTMIPHGMFETNNCLQYARDTFIH